MSKIIGNTTATPVAIPDWKQTDSSKADYIKNKPDFDELSAKVGESSVSDQILLAIDNIDFPVDSVNGKTGSVTLTASDVGATTKDYVDDQIANAKSYTDTKVAGLVNSAPETLDTLNELADALGDDPNFATTMATELGKKATKVELETHNHNDVYYTETEIDNMLAQKSQVQIITWGADD
jgi:hypothetical protein